MGNGRRSPFVIPARYSLIFMVYERTVADIIMLYNSSLRPDRATQVPKPGNQIFHRNKA